MTLNAMPTEYRIRHLATNHLLASPHEFASVAAMMATMHFGFGPDDFAIEPHEKQPTIEGAMARLFGEDPADALPHRVVHSLFGALSVGVLPTRADAQEFIDRFVAEWMRPDCRPVQDAVYQAEQQARRDARIER